MAKNYGEFDDLGVRFVYPKNWLVHAETLDKGTHNITVDSPEGSFWSLSIMPKGTDLLQTAKELVRTMQLEYDEMEEHEIKRYVADRVLAGYEIDFFYLDLTSTATALIYEDDERGYIVYWQTCDHLAVGRDDMSRSDIFDAMTHTLVSNLTGQDQDWDDLDNEDQEADTKSERERRMEEERAYYKRKYELAKFADAADSARDENVGDFVRLNDSTPEYDDYDEPRSCYDYEERSYDDEADEDVDEEEGEED